MARSELGGGGMDLGQDTRYPCILVSQVLGGVRKSVCESVSICETEKMFIYVDIYTCMHAGLYL